MGPPDARGVAPAPPEGENRFVKLAILAVICLMYLMASPLVLLWVAVKAGAVAGWRAALDDAVTDVRAVRWHWRHAGWTQEQIDREEMDRIRSRFPRTENAEVPRG